MRALRSLLVGVLLVLTLGTGAAPASAAEPASGPTLPQLEAIPASVFLDSIGVNTHMGYRNTPYARSPALVATRLRELGIRHVRDTVPLDHDAGHLDRLRGLEAAGMRFDLVAPRPAAAAGTDGARIAPFLASVGATFPASTESIEGANEYDGAGVPGWAAILKRYQAALHASAHTAVDPVLDALPVLAPSLVGSSMATTAPQLEGITGVDGGNVHVYPLGGPPESAVLAQRMELSRRYLSGPDAPVTVTEAGYHNALNARDAHVPVPEDVAGVYVPRLLFDTFRQGVPRTFLYELLDEGTPGDGITTDEAALTDREAHFGLLRFDLSYKPAATALRTLTRLLADDASPDAAPAPDALGVDVAGAPADLQRVLLQKSDGSFVLALWRTQSVWNPSTRKPIAAPEAPVTVSTDRSGSLAAFRVDGRADPAADPAAEPAPIATAAGSSLPVSVGPALTLVRIDAPAPPSAPRDVRVDGIAGGLDVRWTAVPGASGYTVTTEPGGHVVPATGISARVSGLDDGGAATVTVTATNTSGTSPPSAPVPAVAGAVPRPPTDVAGLPGSGSALVSWAPDPDGASPSAYRVTVEPGGAVVDVPGGGGPPPTSAQVNGLADGTAYTFRVESVTPAGTSVPSAASRAVVPGRPGVPQMLGAAPGSRSAVVSWVPPAGPAPSEYVVTASPGGAGVLVPGGATRRAVVPDLADGTAYRFTVMARNGAGSGDVSALSPSVVPGPPGAPTNVRGVAGDRSVTVSWSAGAGPAPNGYTVTASPGGATATLLGGSGAPPPTTATMTGLSNGTPYTFTVTPRNGIGDGPVSAPSAPVTPAAPPVTVQENGQQVRIGGWSLVPLTGSSAGTSRVSATPNDTAALTATTTALSTVLRTGPDRGRVALLVDGVARATVDLYSATPGTVTRTFSGLPSRTHTITVRVTGAKAAASTGTSVALDGWRIGSAAVDDSDRRVVLSGWRGVAATAASGGALRLHRASGSAVTIAFTGTSIDWVGARGPAYGRARVLLDGVDVGSVDAYAKTQQWRVVLVRRTVPAGPHTLTVQVLGTKAAAATTADVPVDAFVVRTG